jgi:hypothetical protein
MKPVIPDQSCITKFLPENQPLPVYIFEAKRIGYPSFLISNRLILNMYMKVREISISGIAYIA